MCSNYETNLGKMQKVERDLTVNYVKYFKNQLF